VIPAALRRGRQVGETRAAPVRVVLLGGGYATLHAYRALVRRLGSRQVQITVVSADDCHAFHGFTGEVLSGVLPLRLTRTPLVEVLPGAEVLHGTVEHVDLDRQVVLAQPASGGAPRRLPYDHLVVATGGREPLTDVPGLAEHGQPLRGPSDVADLLDRLAALERAGGGRVVVAGGGLAGVELAAAVADRRAVGGDLDVVLVHGGPELLPALRRDQPGLAARAERELDRLGVRVMTGTRITAVGRRAVRLADGSLLPADLVLATTGQRPVPLRGLERLPHDRAGRLVTDRSLRVTPAVWAAGDAARVVHPVTGRPVPANALWAIKAGAHLGRSLARTLAGRAPREFRYRGLGQAAAFSPGRSVAELYGVPLVGVVAWLLRLGFFLRFMPQRRRAAAVVAALLRLPARGRLGRADAIGGTGASPVQAAVGPESDPVALGTLPG
jgi:NADH dehydrogenase